jgi:RNA polymerase sigma factor (sigma-70 family)
MAPSDGELLHDYAQHGSQDAFSQIVNRYLNLVHGVALRQVRQPDVADDVAQAVFMILARRARSVPAEHLPGWLIQTSRFCVRDVLKLKARREYHEQQSVILKSTAAPLAPDTSIDHLSHFLDDALSRLRPRESSAVAMRYLQDKSTAEVAAAMGITPDSAQKIIARSLVKLRRILSSQGVALPSAAAVGAGLFAWADHAAPTALAGVISYAASDGDRLTRAASIANHARRSILLLKARRMAAIALLVVLVGGIAISVFARLEQRPAVVAAPPSTAWDFASPFIELVGSRIKQTVKLDLLSTAPLPPATVTENQYIQFEWVDDPGGGAFDRYELTIASAGSDPRAAGQALWHVSAMRPDVHTVVFGRTPPGASAQQAAPLKAGRYVAMIQALRLTASTPQVRRQAIAPFTVEQYRPLTVIAIRDAGADGKVNSLVAIQGVNTSAGYAPGGTYTPPPDVVTKEIDDADGEALPFHVQTQANRSVCQFNFKQAIAPGEPAMFRYLFEESLHENADHTITWRAIHPAGETAARRFELFRLPAGAKVISVTPPDLARRTVDGQLQVFAQSEHDQKMPTSEIVYRLDPG